MILVLTANINSYSKHKLGKSYTLTYIFEPLIWLAQKEFVPEDKLNIHQTQTL